jgi:hypothetical protein
VIGVKGVGVKGIGVKGIGVKRKEVKGYSYMCGGHPFPPGLRYFNDMCIHILIDV